MSLPAFFQHFPIQQTLPGAALGARHALGAREARWASLLPSVDIPKSITTVTGVAEEGDRVYRVLW